MVISEKHKLVRLLIVYVSTSLLFLVFRTSQIVEAARVMLLYLLAPGPKVVSKILNETGRIGERVARLVSASEENKVLRERLNFLLQDRDKLQEVIAENQRLRRIVDYQEKAPYELVSARVVGWTPSLFSSGLLIDKGIDQGIKKDAPVVTWQESKDLSDNGMVVVGRINESSPDMSRVLLITDPNSEIAAMVQRSREQGVVAGTGDRFLLLKYLLPTGDLKVGDLIITSGMGRTFPAGLTIGSVEEVMAGVGGLEKRARVVPRLDINNLEDVQIILAGKSQISSEK